jgi:hypothetical protein
VTREPDSTGFDEIVASWRAEGGVPEWPDDTPADAPTTEPRAAESPRRTEPSDDDSLADLFRADPATEHSAPDPDAQEQGPAEKIRPSERPAQESLADEHFVPPDPPPLPRMGPPILVGLTLIALGLVLVSFPGWVGVPQVYGLPLGLVAIAAGLGWLVLRLWPDPDDVPPPLYLDDPDDPDGGAVL